MVGAATPALVQPVVPNAATPLPPDTAPSVPEILPTPSPTTPPLTPPSRPTPDSNLTPLPPATSEVKPTEVKPTEVKPTEVKPVEVEPTEAKPVEVKPTEAKPALQAEGIVELRADQQTYDRDRQVFTAEGNVSMKFRNSLLVADRVQVNLLNRFTVAEGKVTLTRGDQVLQGDRFEYNFVQGEGKIRGARGELYVPSLGDEPRQPLPTDISASTNFALPIGERIYANQPAQNVQSQGGINVTAGSRSSTSGIPLAGTASAAGNIRRLRYEADSADFDPTGLVAANVRLTNDPFSPPELELRTPKLRVTRLSPLRDEIKAEKPRLVFDQRFKLPIFQNRVVIDRRRRTPGLFQPGFDDGDRGGLFIGRTIDVISQPNWSFSLTPQFLLQRAIQNGVNSDAFGLKAKLTANISERTTVRAIGDLSSFDLSKFEDRFRGSLRAQHLIGTHTLSLEGSYRDRLFNNSLGFQNVQSSLGLLFYSPSIPIGKTGINFSYQLGYQSIRANTDRLDLLNPIRANDRITLNRFQSSVALSRGFILWQGNALPATPEAGLRYTPTPLKPYVGVDVGLTGVASLYSNGDTQRSVGANVRLAGQFGHSSKNFFDYTAFNITYSNLALGGLSPFLFDRTADTQILFAGITQQVYGPWRLGFQTAWNLNTGKEISTDYLVEYSRRTHSVLLRYNPVQKLGSISFQISDFNWAGGASERFGGSGVRGVSSGVESGLE
jgi:Protein of unknown function (DUF3769)